MNKHTVAAIICFCTLPVFSAGMIILYGHLAAVYGRPDHFLVNATAMTGLTGTVLLIVFGIINAVKGSRK